MDKKDVSIVICAYNEEPTIKNVVESCHRYNPASEIVVVDDGSQDATRQIIEELKQTIPINYIPLEENQGKSYAMVVGVEKASRDIILFFDADITNIKKEHFDQLLDPVFNQEADMVLGQPSETLIDYRINPFKGLTGERAMLKKDIEPILEDIRDIRFGVETYINLYFQAYGKKLKYSVLEGLAHPTKYEKTTPMKATMEFISEGQEIAATLLKNYDLITRRIESSFNSHNEKVKEKIRQLHAELNENIQSLLKNGKFKE
ncbi:MAG: glycosyltransferase family 2 protein [Bacteroidales bacterium]|jgi:glycosyltransferase involved in cell wall biosynthesis|nr:glycosyltransferase family 2 protein [Bacteroidales bacterium]